MIKKKTVLVIGTGPSGLCVAKHLIDHPGLFTQVDIVEEGSQIGGTFRNKSYEDGKMVSSTYITAFSDYRWHEFTAEKQKGDSHHAMIDKYLEYLDAYTEKFDLLSRIHFNKKVVNVVKSHGKYKVFFANQIQPSTYDYVCLCSGLHHLPFIPDVYKKVKNPTAIMHSIDYKTKEVMRNKRVLIVGCGETAMDIAYHATGVSKSVAMVIRDGFLSAPTRLTDNVPLDTFITNLFECSYVHPYVEKFRIKQMITTVFFRAGFLIFTGASVGYNQWVGGLANVKRGYHIINKQDKALPYLNRPYKQKSWRGRWFYKDPLDDPKRHYIRVYKNEVKNVVEVADSETSTRVIFTDDRAATFDLIILCTGYEQKFNMDLPHGKSTLPNERNIVFSDDLQLPYFGFVRPNVGAIPPMTELQILWWLRRIQNGVKLPLAKTTYNLLRKNKRTINYSVDYGNYMHVLGRDIGVAPNLFSRFFLVDHPKALLSYMFGQAYISFFRLQGAYADSHSLKVSEKELYQVVKNRGIITNIIFLFIF